MKKEKSEVVEVDRPPFSEIKEVYGGYTGELKEVIMYSVWETYRSG